MKPIDLTLTISKNTPTFPGSPKPQFISWSTLKDDGYNLEMLFLSSHTGTHVDAPFHFNCSGTSIHQIPVSRFCGEALLMKVDIGKNQVIMKKDIQRFEDRTEKISRGSSIFFFTGWQKFLKNDNYFVENPGLSECAALYLASKQINLVGIDSPSIDRGSDSKFSAHRILLENDILVVENLANLGKISKHRFRFAVLPLKLRGATGSPVRAVAF